MAVQIKQQIFSRPAQFTNWVRSRGVSGTPGRYPYILSYSPTGDGTGIRVVYVDDSVHPGDVHAQSARGLAGLNIAAGMSTAGAPIGTSMSYVPVGEQEDVDVSGETVGAVSGAGPYTHTLSRGMVVPGSVVVTAPGKEDSYDVTPEADLEAGQTRPNADGTLDGENVASASINYITRALAITFDGAPDPGNVEVDYSYNPFPASSPIPSGAHLLRLELHHVSGTGTPTFQWQVAEDPDGVFLVPGLSGVTGVLGAGQRASIPLDALSVNQSLLASDIGKRWVGLQASTGGDHVVEVKLVFKPVT